MNYLNCLNNLAMIKKLENILKNTNKKIVFICMGNIKVNFDSFASHVAMFLRKYNVNAIVYGGEKYPLYGESLQKMKNFLHKAHKNDIIVFVDVVKTNIVSQNGKIIISTKKFQVANSKVVFNYDYSICYMVKIDEQYDHYIKQYEAGKKIATYIANCC